jgi:predicted helicase
MFEFWHHVQHNTTIKTLRWSIPRRASGALKAIIGNIQPPIITITMPALNTLLSKFRQSATDNRNLGDKFERLIANVLVTDPLYAEKYSDVWLWGEWQHRSGADVGIDLVAKTQTGDYCAIKCKFYAPDHQLQKADIDSFFTASGKTFATNEGAKTFTSRIIVSTTDKWSKHAEEALEHQQIPVTRLTLNDLQNSAIDWEQFSLERPDKIQLKPKKQLRPHQKTALEKVETGFKTADRGKLIMACGTGKTYTALKIAEKITPEHGIVLFLVPSIALLSQTLREWTTEANKTLQSFAVCSDTKVGKKSDNEDISIHDLAFPATTDTHKLVNQVQAFHGKNNSPLSFPPINP